MKSCISKREKNNLNSIIVFSFSMYNVINYVKLLKASGNAEFGTIFDATNSFDIFIGSNKEFPMMGLRWLMSFIKIHFSSIKNCKCITVLQLVLFNICMKIRFTLESKSWYLEWNILFKYLQFRLIQIEVSLSTTF